MSYMQDFPLVYLPTGIAALIVARKLYTLIWSPLSEVPGPVSSSVYYASSIIILPIAMP